MTREVREQFTSDFKIVTDFFAEKNREDYTPSKETIQHVEAVLEMLRVFTNDPTYEKIKSELLQWSREGRAISMCTFADRMKNLGIQQGIEQGIAQGREQGIMQERLRNKKILAEKEKIIHELKLKLAALN